jgi:HlyD family secretion protein
MKDLDLPAAASDDTRPDLAQLARMPRRRRGRRWVWFVLLAALLAGAGYWWETRPPTPIIYDTTPARTGELTVTVIATGTVQPTTRVDISSELSGTLAAVEVDFNDIVTEGQVLARLDDTKLRAQVATAEAQLVSARAKLMQAEATATETAEALTQAQALDERGLSARTAIVAAQAADDRARAAVEMARADVTIAEGNLAQQQADLEKAVIRSPINGIVLDRTAEKGQIVAATLNAPVLFTLAEDLSRMELRVSVDEADIGRVAVGQEASFSVDAYPGQRFDAVITQLRYAPDATENVVSYTAVLSVTNEDLLLRPGMTATAEITVARVEEALLVPVAALRYAPPADQSASRAGRGLLGYIMPGRPPSANRGRVDGSGIWVLRDGAAVRVKITPGATDGSEIVVTSEELKDGDEVILSQREAG